MTNQDFALEKMFLKFDEKNKDRLDSVFEWARRQHIYMILGDGYIPYNNDLGFPAFEEIGGYGVVEECPYEGYEPWLSVWEEDTGLYPCTIHYPIRPRPCEKIEVILETHRMESFCGYSVEWVHGEAGLFNQKLSPLVRLAIAEFRFDNYLESITETIVRTRKSFLSGRVAVAQQKSSQLD